LGFPNQHETVAEQVGVRFQWLRQVFNLPSEQVVRDDVTGSFKPKDRHSVEDATFVWDGSGQDDIKSAYSVCGDN
jgi:hypothetical protein